MTCRTFKCKTPPNNLPPALPSGCASVEITTGDVVAVWRCEGEARISSDRVYVGAWRDPKLGLPDQRWLTPEMIDWDLVREHEAKHGKKFGDMCMRAGVLNVDLWYPRLDDKEDRQIDHPVAVEVGLMDVRAADSIRIEYDFERDGWSIKQASVFSWTADDKVCDRGWQEVAFVQAWALEKPGLHSEDCSACARPCAEHVDFTGACAASGCEAYKQ